MKRTLASPALLVMLASPVLAQTGGGTGGGTGNPGTTGNTGTSGTTPSGTGTGNTGTTNGSGTPETRDDVTGSPGIAGGNTLTGRIGHMDIPRLGLRAAVVEGIASKDLRLGVGHVPLTAFPGEPDNAAFAAHRDTHFRKLRRVEKGDSIRIATTEGVFRTWSIPPSW